MSSPTSFPPNHLSSHQRLSHTQKLTRIFQKSHSQAPSNHHLLSSPPEKNTLYPHILILLMSVLILLLSAQLQSNSARPKLSKIEFLACLSQVAITLAITASALHHILSDLYHSHIVVSKSIFFWIGYAVLVSYALFSLLSWMMGSWGSARWWSRDGEILEKQRRGSAEGKPPDKKKKKQKREAGRKLVSKRRSSGVAFNPVVTLGGEKLENGVEKMRGRGRKYDIRDGKRYLVG